MNYSDLTRIQKRLIDAYIQARPELANHTSISREVVEELHAELYEKRKIGGEKFGYPVWLVKGPKVSRGVYVFPSPNAVTATVTQLKSTSNQKANNASLDKEDKEFFEELKQYGIMS